VDVVARDLLGCRLLRKSPNGSAVGGVIVETEAYSEDDPASHSHRGPTPRNRSMFGPPGHIYVYRIYGVHLCLNVVTGPEGEGSAVLMRALEPTEGIEAMRQRRGVAGVRDICNGPAKLCQALGVEESHDGEDLWGEFTILRGPGIEPARIAESTRIGITRASEVRRRYLIAGDPFVSRGPAATP
jgi:DNA-3-methyladenine glycosylase